MTSSELSAVATALRAAILSHNRELYLTAMVKAGLGLILIAVIGFFSFLIFWFIVSFGFRLSNSRMIALGIVTLYQVVAFVSAWRHVDPMAGVSLTGSEIATRNVVNSATYFATGIPVLRREGLAAAASALIGGPANVLEAVADWRGRLPCGDEFIAEAAKVMADAPTKPTAESVNPRAAAVLYRLGLIKAERGEGGQMQIATTQKGLELLGAIPSIRREPNSGGAMPSKNPAVGDR